MALNTTPAPTDILYTALAFQQKWLLKFADNQYQNIIEGTFREFIQDLVQTFANWSELTTNRVRGGLFRVPTLAVDSSFPAALVPAKYRILGMQAVVINGTDPSTAAAGVQADPIFFQLIADSSGTVDALVDELATTTATKKARWVRTSGTDEERQATFPAFIEEDHAYQAGDVFKYYFPVLEVTRLFEVRTNILTFVNPTPTGEDDDPNYAPYSPLVLDDAAVVLANSALMAAGDAQAAATAAQAMIGLLGTLLTTNKASVVAAINELYQDKQALAEKNVAGGYLGLDLDGLIDIARIPALPQGRRINSSGGIADLTSPQQALIGQGTIVTTTDGYRWSYNGTGTKTDEANYIQVADITPIWSVIENKPAFGTASLLNVASSGNAAAGEVVKGNDTRLSAVATNATAIEAVRTTLLATADQTANFTLALGDAGYQVPVNSATGVTGTVPNDSTVAFPVGTLIEFIQENTGQVTFAGASGVTVENADGQYKTAKRLAIVQLRKKSANLWRLSGYTAS
jgi:hypothetical protein